MKQQYITPETLIRQMEVEQVIAGSDVTGGLPGFTPGSFNW